MHHIKLIATAIVAVAAIEDIVVDRINKKRFKNNLDLGRDLERENEQLREALSVSAGQNLYLIDMLQRNEIAPDEFDMIALNSFQK